jgi:hypothetical protein
LTKVFSKNLNEKVVQVASLPQPASPFRWANYVETKDKVYQGFVDFLKEESSSSASREAERRFNYFLLFRRWGNLNNLYWPPGQVQYKSWEKFQDSPWVKKALTTDGVKFYYWFARFPVVSSVNSKDGRHRVEFVDVRFLVPNIRPHFIYHVEFDDSGKILSEGFVGDQKKNKQNR